MDEYKVTVPEGESGGWKVEKFTVTKEQARLETLRDPRRYICEGTYTQLKRGEETIMSDVRAEIRDHYEMFMMAKGHILINGLGIGMVLQACLRNPEVTKATVIEESEDVIRLVAPHYKKMFGDRVEIIHADAMEWKPPKGSRYGAVWHDIWDTICSDNLESMKTLHRRFGRFTDWQGSWCRDECKRLEKAGY